MRPKDHGGRVQDDMPEDNRGMEAGSRKADGNRRDTAREKAEVKALDHHCTTASTGKVVHGTAMRTMVDKEGDSLRFRKTVMRRILMKKARKMSWSSQSQSSTAARLRTRRTSDALHVVQLRI